jgi:hypothetical protein
MVKRQRGDAMGQQAVFAGLVGSFLFLARLASAQAVSGTVVDASSARPLSGAAITVLTSSTTVGTARTNDSGRFEIKLPAVGSYTVRVTRLGHTATTTSVRVEAAGHDAVYRLAALPTTLDPVTARAGAPTTFGPVTPGRDLYRANTLLNLGQTASGLEIQQSRLTVTEFLGQLIPGLKLVKSLPPPAPGSDHPNSPATIPGRNGFVVATSEQPCIFARIDRWGLAGLLDQYDVATLDDIVDAADVMGVEVYSKFSEVPTTYRADAVGKQMVWRTGSVDRNYFVGDLGMPHVARPTLRAQPGEEADERTSPREVRWLRGAGQPAGIKPPLDSLWEYCLGKLDATGLRLSPSSVPPCTQANPKPDSILYKIWGKLVPIDTVRPPSFALPSMSVPQCGFVQVWTRVSW